MMLLLAKQKILIEKKNPQWLSKPWQIKKKFFKELIYVFIINTHIFHVRDKMNTEYFYVIWMNEEKFFTGQDRDIAYLSEYFKNSQE